MTHDQITGEVVITATEFKAKCLDLIDRLQRGTLNRVTITKRGKEAAVMNQADHGRQVGQNDIYGCLKGRMIAPADYDFTAPMDIGPLDSELGIID